jgi:hypothetical protein
MAIELIKENKNLSLGAPTYIKQEVDLTGYATE